MQPVMPAETKSHVQYASAYNIYSTARSFACSGTLVLFCRGRPIHRHESLILKAEHCLPKV